MDSNVQKEQLIYRFLIGDMTDSEMHELQNWLDESVENQQLLEKICKELQIVEEGKIFYQVEDEMMWQNFKSRLLLSRIDGRKRLVRRLFRYAAVIIFPVMVALAGWMLFQQNSLKEQEEMISQNIVPGDNRAILVLSNGEQKILEGEQQGEMEIVEGIKAEHDKMVLRYDSALAVVNTQHKLIYNTLKTPRGGEFQVILADGTKVWMNAGSQLRYPITFSGTERKVYLSGEAYFEVTRDTCRPFYVITDEVHIRVYGTSFNVNTNRLTEIQTVLVKGAIGIGKNGSEEEILLKPGELAEFNLRQKNFRIEKVNTAQYTAWKEGYFAFENESLEEIMAMLGRWYDVEIFFSSDSLKSLKFTGYMRKYESIKQILEAIQEVVEVQFSVRHQTIIISK